MNPAQKPVLVHIVESALREQTDEPYQRRVWLDGSPTEISNMNEATATSSGHYTASTYARECFSHAYLF
jgi:hypothetical protein